MLNCKKLITDSTKKNGWCLDLQGKEPNSGQISLRNASSPEDCLTLCKKQKGAKGCEYRRNGECSYHTNIVASGSGHQDVYTVCWILTKGITRVYSLLYQ